jgi:hypothetical protein
MYKANLDAWNASLYLPDSDIPFVTVEVPRSTSGAQTELIINQRVVLENPDEITKYSIITFKNETYKYYLKGKGHLRLGPLPKISVKYDKTVEQQGEAAPSPQIAHRPIVLIMNRLKRSTGFRSGQTPPSTLQGRRLPCQYKRQNHAS